MGAFEGFALVPEQGSVPAKSQLPQDLRLQIEQLAAGLDVRDGAAVMGFGAKAQKEMGIISDSALQRMMCEDIAPPESVLRTLAEQVRACSLKASAKGFLHRAFGAAATLAEVREQYERAVPRIDRCADELTDRRVALMRDNALLDRLYERNEALYRELCSLLVVGEEALSQARARGEDAQTLARLERRLQDLRVTHVASTQLAAQIRAVQASDALTCEKLRTASDVTIPLWKSQMATALGIARATDSLTAARRASDEAERGIRSGARQVRAQTRAYASAAEQADRERAEQTAAALLAELSQIESSLREQTALRRRASEPGMTPSQQK